MLRHGVDRTLFVPLTDRAARVQGIASRGARVRHRKRGARFIARDGDVAERDATNFLPDLPLRNAKRLAGFQNHVVELAIDVVVAVNLKVKQNIAVLVSPVKHDPLRVGDVFIPPQGLIHANRGSELDPDGGHDFGPITCQRVGFRVLHRRGAFIPRHGGHRVDGRNRKRPRFSHDVHVVFVQKGKVVHRAGVKVRRGGSRLGADDRKRSPVLHHGARGDPKRVLRRAAHERADVVGAPPCVVGNTESMRQLVEERSRAAFGVDVGIRQFVGRVGAPGVQQTAGPCREALADGSPFMVRPAGFGRAAVGQKTVRTRRRAAYTPRAVSHEDDDLIRVGVDLRHVAQRSNQRAHRSPEVVAFRYALIRRGVVWEAVRAGRVVRWLYLHAVNRA